MFNKNTEARMFIYETNTPYLAIRPVFILDLAKEQDMLKAKVSASLTLFTTKKFILSNFKYWRSTFSIRYRLTSHHLKVDKLRKYFFYQSLVCGQYCLQPKQFAIRIIKLKA